MSSFKHLTYITATNTARQFATTASFPNRIVSKLCLSQESDCFRIHPDCELVISSEAWRERNWQYQMIINPLPSAFFVCLGRWDFMGCLYISCQHCLSCSTNTGQLEEDNGNSVHQIKKYLKIACFVLIDRENKWNILFVTNMHINSTQLGQSLWIIFTLFGCMRSRLNQWKTHIRNYCITMQEVWTLNIM